MASHLLAALQRAKLEQFPQEIPVDDLNTYFRFTLADREHIDDLRGPTNQFGCVSFQTTHTNSIKMRSNPAFIQMAL
jgi:hypothetical protein